MKIAYLIMAHKNPEQLARLVKTLTYKNEEFFIHIDKKYDVKPFADHLNSLEDPAIHFIQDRQRVRFSGGYSQTEAVVRSLIEIFSGPCDFYRLILLSGQDYPVKSNEFILDFFEKNRGKEFIKLFPLPAERQARLRRLAFRLDRYCGYYFDDFFQGPFLRFLNRVSRLLPRKQFPKGHTPYFGPTYWQITRECAEYLVKFIRNNPRFRAFFRFSLCSDECFFHTILLNSPFAANVIHDNHFYIDWGIHFHPKVLTQEDFEKLKDPGIFFARKFDMFTEPGMLDLVDKKLLCE